MLYIVDEAVRHTPFVKFQNQKLPTYGLGGYITATIWGVPDAYKRGTESEVAHKWAGWHITLAVRGVPNTLEPGTKSEVAPKWADWLHHPCLLCGPQRVRAGDKIRSGPHVGLVATSTLPFGESPML